MAGPFSSDEGIAPKLAISAENQRKCETIWGRNAQTIAQEHFGSVEQRAHFAVAALQVEEREGAGHNGAIGESGGTEISVDAVAFREYLI